MLQFFFVGGLAATVSLVASLSAGPAQVPDAYEATVVTARQAYDIPDRVEVRYDGIWYAGTIIAVRGTEYQVKRDDYPSDDRWSTSANLRRLVKRESKPLASPFPLPRDVPTGSYLCKTVATGFYSSSSTSAIIGTMQVVGSGAYTGVSKAGKGTRSHFTYAPQSGKIEWEGGALKGFFGTIDESHLTFDSQHSPIVVVTYRVREGGSQFELSCQRA
jgi:hypothetical protein